MRLNVSGVTPIIEAICPSLARLNIVGAVAFRNLYFSRAFTRLNFFE